MTTVIECRPSGSRMTIADLKALKTKQHGAWSSGDYAVIGTTLQIVGEQLAEAMDLRRARRYSTSLPATAMSRSPPPAADARSRQLTMWKRCSPAAASVPKRTRLEVDFQIADAENLPFAAASFDAVVSAFGGMFSPDQDRTATELLRVCKSGGRIGLANWTPDGFIGQMFKTIGKYLPPPVGVNSPAVWGTRNFIMMTFGEAASAIVAEPRHFTLRYRSAQHFLDVFRTYYGPMLKAFEALDEAGGKALARDIVDLVGRCNRSGDQTMVVPSEYLEIVITKR